MITTHDALVQSQVTRGPPPNIIIVVHYEAHDWPPDFAINSGIDSQM